MSYYHIELSPFSHELCRIVRCGVNTNIFVYRRGSSTVLISSRRRCLRLWRLEFVRMYLDDCRCLTSGTWEDHLEKLEQVLVTEKRRSESKRAKVLFWAITARISSLLDYPRWYPTITKESASNQRFDGTKNT